MTENEDDLSCEYEEEMNSEENENKCNISSQDENEQTENAKGIFEPKSFEEALETEDCDEWIKSMQEEIQSINDNEAWELVDLPHGRKAVGCKWVYKVKKNAQGNMEKYKARLVAKGFSQKYGVDYHEVFAPVARSVTMKLLLSVAGRKGYTVKHYDNKTAFLNGNLREEIYMKQPPGFEEGEKVFKLKKSLYGLSVHKFKKQPVYGMKLWMRH